MASNAYEVDIDGQTYEVDSPENAMKLMQAFAQRNSAAAKPDQPTQPVQPQFGTLQNVLANNPDQSINPFTGFVRGLEQGFTYNKTPELLSLLGENTDEQRKIFKATEEQYPGLSLAGNVVGSIASPISKLGEVLAATKNAGVLSRVLKGALVNTGLGQISTDVNDQDRTGTAAKDFSLSLLLDAIGGPLGKAGQAIKQKLSPVENLPYKEGVNARLVNALEELKQETGKGVTLSPEQILRDPSFYATGTTKKLANTQHDEANKIAMALEGTAGLPSGKATNLASSVSYDAMAPRIDPYALSENIGVDILKAKNAHLGKYEQAFGDLKSKLSSEADVNINPTFLKDSVSYVEKELKKGLGADTRSAAAISEIKDKLNKVGTIDPITGIREGINLDSLFKMRSDLTDMAYETTSSSDKILLNKLKNSVDLEMQNYASNLSAKSKELGNEALGLIQSFKQDADKFDNKAVASIYKRMNEATPENFDIKGVMSTLDSSLKNGDLKSLQALEMHVNPEVMNLAKQSAMQDVLRGANADVYDLAGITSRLNSIKSNDAKKMLFGDQLTQVENLGKIGEVIGNSMDYAKNRHNLPILRSVGDPQSYMNVVSYLAGKFNNHPTIINMLTRDHKKILNNSAASFAAKRFVDKLFTLEAQDQGIDSTVNKSSGE